MCPTTQPRPKQTNKQRMSKTHKCGWRPCGPLLGEYALQKRAYCPNRGTSRLRHSCSGNSNSGGVTLLTEPSTKTSNAAITRGRLTVCPERAAFQPQQWSRTPPPETGHFFNFRFSFFQAPHLSTPYWAEILPARVNFFSPPPSDIHLTASPLRGIHLTASRKSLTYVFGHLLPCVLSSSCCAHEKEDMRMRAESWA